SAAHAPRVVARGGRVFVVWHEATAGFENVWLAVSRDRGKTFGAPIHVSDHPPGTVVELNPAVAVRGRHLFVVWQQFTTAHDDNKWAPAIAASGSTLYLAWPDFRKYNWDVFVARSTDGGATWSPNVQVDDFPDLERLDERPTLGIDRDGTLHVAWTDLRARE